MLMPATRNSCSRVCRSTDRLQLTLALSARVAATRSRPGPSDPPPIAGRYAARRHPDWCPRRRARCSPTPSPTPRCRPALPPGLPPEIRLRAPPALPCVPGTSMPSPQIASRTRSPLSLSPCIGGRLSSNVTSSPRRPRPRHRHATIAPTDHDNRPRGRGPVPAVVDGVPSSGSTPRTRLRRSSPSSGSPVRTGRVNSCRIPPALAAAVESRLVTSRAARLMPTTSGRMCPGDSDLLELFFVRAMSASRSLRSPIQ